MNTTLRSSLAMVSAIGAITALTGCHTTPTKSASVTPCLNVLPLFTAANVPAFAPTEIVCSENYTNGITRSGLPGKGLAQHPMLYVGENCNKMFLVHDGKVIWTYSTGPRPEFDDVWMLSNGNILFSRMEYIAIIMPDKKVVWRYDGATMPRIQKFLITPKSTPASSLAWTMSCC